MKIWVISIFENTPVDDNQNTRFNSLVNEALSRGHNVTYWASTFRHNEKKQRYKETTVLHPVERLELQFIVSKKYNKNISLSRLLSHRSYANNLIRAFKKKKKPDIILFAFPPISVANKISKWALKNSIPCIVDIIDPWPDAFLKHLKYFPEVLLTPLRNSVTKIMKNVSAVTAISNQYIVWAKRYNSRLEVTRCFYPAVQFDEMQKELEEASKKVSKMVNEFTVIYAGSLGYSYDIKTILGAAEKLESTLGSDIKFIIAGDGPQKDIIMEYERNHGNLTYVGRVPKKKLMEYYYTADVGLTQHVEGATQSVTYKLFDLLACGLPILNSLESEMREVVIQNKVGLHNPPGDVLKLYTNLLKLFDDRALLEEMKFNAIELTKKKGDSKKVYSEYIDFIESVNSVPAGLFDEQ